jgi:amidase
VAIKDSIDVAGVPTQAGSRALADAAPAAGHAEVVERLLAAGYRITGKVTMHELAFGTTGINAWAGTPVNPLSGSRARRLVQRLRGGGGRRAGGCGHRLRHRRLDPHSRGLLRRVRAQAELRPGQPPGRDAGAHQPRLRRPFAADMDSLIACMRAIDPGFGELPGLDGVSVGLVDVPARDVIREAVAGRWPQRPAGRAGEVRTFRRGLPGRAGGHQRRNLGRLRPLVETGKVGPDVAQRLLNAARTTQADVDAANQCAPPSRPRWMPPWNAAVLALPTMADAPPSLDQAADTSRLVSMTSLVRPFNLSGHPAIAIPLPARSGFPVSLQLVAAKGRDELLCAVARHVASRLQ